MAEHRILISEYESEECWKDPASFSLPALQLFRRPHQLLMNGMDGLTTLMAEAGDQLVTKTPLPDSYQAYWNTAVVKLQYYSPPNDTVSASPRTIYRSLMEDAQAHSLIQHSRIEHYALVPDAYAMADALHLPVPVPAASVVELLNRKSYANELRIRHELPGQGINLHSIEDYERAIPHMLDQYGCVLIKDSMGVSGKGILPIESTAMAERFAAHFRKQEAQGKTVFDFVLEPQRNRKTDFSCQFHITASGETVIDGYQKNRSRGFAYYGSEALEQEELELLDTSGYAETIRMIAGDLASAGYTGYACVDSMITQENQVIPLLEINPRMSMGRFNLKLSEKLNKKCRLAFTEGIRAQGVAIDHILQELDEAGILYTKDRHNGILPLAPNTWCLPECAGQKIRIYYVSIFDTEEEYESNLDSWIGYCAGRICTGAVR